MSEFPFWQMKIAGRLPIKPRSPVAAKPASPPPVSKATSNWSNYGNDTFGLSLHDPQVGRASATLSFGRDNKSQLYVDLFHRAEQAAPGAGKTLLRRIVEHAGQYSPETISGHFTNPAALGAFGSTFGRENITFKPRLGGESQSVLFDEAMRDPARYVASARLSQVVPKVSFAPFWEKTAASNIQVAGLCVYSRGTGRVLMLQRAYDPTGKDPAHGMWEFPGGHIEPGETELEAAKREWSEETGMTIPRGSVKGAWTQGIYRGFVWSIPNESQLALNQPHSDRKVINPDDPDGDRIETVAWWDPEQLLKNPALRPELRSSMRKVREAIFQEKVATAPSDSPAPIWSRKLAGVGEFGPYKRVFSSEARRLVDDKVQQEIRRSLQQLAAKKENLRGLAEKGQRLVEHFQPSALAVRKAMSIDSPTFRPLSGSRRSFLKFTTALALSDDRIRRQMVNQVAAPLRGGVDAIVSPETNILRGSALAMQRSPMLRKQGKRTLGLAAVGAGLTGAGAGLSYLMSPKD